jgi:HD superfamily phosphohydrolase
MKFCRVINNEICFDAKEVYNVYEMFHTRYSLFKTVYSHRVGNQNFQINKETHC